MIPTLPFQVGRDASDLAVDFGLRDDAPAVGDRASAVADDAHRRAALSASAVRRVQSRGATVPSTEANVLPGEADVPPTEANVW